MPTLVPREMSSAARQLLRVEASADDRKSRLFACGCARLAWQLLEEPAARRAVVLAEDFAEGRVSAAEFRAASAEARRIRRDAPRFHSDDKRRYRALTVVYHAAHAGQKAAPLFGHAVAALEALPVDLRDASGAELIQCVFGRPEVVSLPAWLDPSVSALAAEISASRAWPRLPELADALVAAGCYSTPLLDHLRSEGPHTRGCWALEAVLGKS